MEFFNVAIFHTFCADNTGSRGKPLTLASKNIYLHEMKGANS